MIYPQRDVLGIIEHLVQIGYQLMYLIVEVLRVHSMVKVGCGTPHHKLLVIMIMNLPI